MPNEWRSVMELAFFRTLTRRERFWIALGYNISLRTNIYTAHKPGAYDGKMSLHVVSDQAAATDGSIPPQVYVARAIQKYRTAKFRFGLRIFALKSAVRRVLHKPSRAP
jgi:hypothetical protein